MPKCGQLVPGTSVMPYVKAITYALGRNGCEVMIKVLSRDKEGATEVDILKFLSTEPLKSDPDNPIVPILEFLEYEIWTFSVSVRWGDSVYPIFKSVQEGIEFCVQVTKVNFDQRI